MKKKKKLLLSISIFATLILSVCVGVFRYYHPTHYKFNDRFVIGSTSDEIIKEYGEPYSSNEYAITYMIHDNTPEIIMSYDNSLWYIITLDNRVATKVSLRKGYLGG